MNNKDPLTDQEMKECADVERRSPGIVRMCVGTTIAQSQKYAQYNEQKGRRRYLAFGGAFYIYGDPDEGRR